MGNDVELRASGPRGLVITGPNMGGAWIPCPHRHCRSGGACTCGCRSSGHVWSWGRAGKSCYIRMAALIAIMAQASSTRPVSAELPRRNVRSARTDAARSGGGEGGPQVGSYVPADRVVMSVLDSVFTRMGASDNLAQGRSTFLEVPPPPPRPPHRPVPGWRARTTCGRPWPPFCLSQVRELRSISRAPARPGASHTNGWGACEQELSETADILHHAGPRSLVVPPPPPFPAPHTQTRMPAHARCIPLRAYFPSLCPFDGFREWMEVQPGHELHTQAGSLRALCAAMKTRRGGVASQVMDELGRGTSTHDGVAIAAAVLRRLVVHNECMLCFVTHYPQVCSSSPAAPPAAGHGAWCS